MKKIEEERAVKVRQREEEKQKLMKKEEEKQALMVEALMAERVRREVEKA